MIILYLVYCILVIDMICFNHIMMILRRIQSWHDSTSVHLLRFRCLFPQKSCLFRAKRVK